MAVSVQSGCTETESVDRKASLGWKRMKVTLLQFRTLQKKKPSKKSVSHIPTCFIALLWVVDIRPQRGNRAIIEKCILTRALTRNKISHRLLFDISSPRNFYFPSVLSPSHSTHIFRASFLQTLCAPNLNFCAVFEKSLSLLFQERREDAQFQKFMHW